MADDHDRRFPLTAAQAGMWFAQELEPQNPIYQAAEYVDIQGEVDLALVEIAVRQAVADIEAFRVRVDVDDNGMVWQVVERLADWPLPVLDLRGTADPWERAREWMLAELNRPVDLRCAPVFRFTVLRLAIDRSLLYLSAHHLTMDGFGFSLFAQRIAEVYTALEAGRECPPSTLGSLDLLLADEASYQASERFTRDREYWAEQLADRPDAVNEYERWPEAARKPSVYALATFAEPYGTTLRRLMDAADLEQLSMAELSTAEEYLMEIADQSQEAAALAEATTIGDTSLAALHRSVEEIGQLYWRTAPLPMFRRAVGLRNRILDLLEGRQLVNQTRELYAAASKVCALLAWMSGDFEQHGAAVAQGDAAWVFAEQADQPAVRALARIAQAKAAHWADQFDKSASYARDGLRYASGNNAVRLACFEARAAADLGDADRALGALRRAEDERDKSGIAETGELFFCGEIERYNYAVNARYLFGDHAGSLEAAVSAIAAAESMPVTERRYNSVAFAHANVAVASIATGDLDRGITSLNTVLVLPSSHRLATLSQRLERAQRLLITPVRQGSKPTRELHAQVSDFRKDTVARALIT